MKAIQYFKDFQFVEQPDPVTEGSDMLVNIEAISVNPVDCKRHRRTETEAVKPVILGWDAAGTVESVGFQVKHFTPGERVFYDGGTV
jgi:NADPH:quinone reductase-like Zn-dependent oxidoreductase